MKMKQMHAARRAADIEQRRAMDALTPRSERRRRPIAELAHDGLEPDIDVRTVCPVIAHKLFGKSDAMTLTAAQRRQVRAFAVDVVMALRKAERLL